MSKGSCYHTPEFYNLVAFLATLLTIGLLSKIGGTGADLAIMTALVAVAGSLVNNFRKSQPVGVAKAERVDQNINGGKDVSLAQSE